jgi:hypothetical protein
VRSAMLVRQRNQVVAEAARRDQVIAPQRPTERLMMVKNGRAILATECRRVDGTAANTCCG